MSYRDIELTTIDGGVTTLAEYADKVVLIVNVASKCGLAPQYEKLEALQKQYEGRGFTVLAFPCNQFLHQEPGTRQEIKEYCAMTWGVTFPLFDKINVNGFNRHPLYAELTAIPDSDGKSGKVRYNFEKFVIAPSGAVWRFRSWTQPNDPELIAAIEAELPAASLGS